MNEANLRESDRLGRVYIPVGLQLLDNAVTFKTVLAATFHGREKQLPRNQTAN